MLRMVARTWPIALLLGCVHTVHVQPPSDPVARGQTTQPVALEPVEPEPVEPEPAEPEPAEPEPSESAPESAIEGGHVVRPTDPVATPGTVPTVEVSEPMVGTMDKDVIRRIVRRHINEIRYCYNLALAKDPTLAAKISIEFTIGPSGAVEQAKATDVNGLADPELPKCIADAIETWVFPEPRGGGRVVVSYPFNLIPG
jgi:hypothetical protein